jgi:4-hydroxymandelate oxidase
MASGPRAGDADVADVVALREFEALARARLDAASADYIGGGSWDELTLAENEAAWRRYRLRPRVLVDVAAVDASTSLLGTPAAFPVAIAPMATHGLAHPDGEVATARAAASAGVPFPVSTMSSRSIEEVASAAPHGVHWFQLYTHADPGRSRALVDRAVAAGYGALLVTVDLPRLGYRERDRRNRFDLPALGNFEGGNRPDHRSDLDGSNLGRLETVGHSLTWGDLAEIRSWTDRPLVLKGVLTAEDAAIALDHGVDGLIVSNHGARQLDRVAAGIDALPAIAEAVAGRVELLVDGGVRRGLDVLIALAEGATGVLVGKPILWALAAGGESGVGRALAILRQETEIAMALLGARVPADVRRWHVERPRTAT